MKKTQKKQRQNEQLAIRNLVAKHQWQRGGVHDKPNKAKRRKAKQQLKRAIRSQSAADFFAYCRFFAIIPALASWLK